jgi:formylglycine-generating enzyme required for sulfatase activity
MRMSQSPYQDPPDRGPDQGVADATSDLEAPDTTPIDLGQVPDLSADDLSGVDLTAGPDVADGAGDVIVTPDSWPTPDVTAPDVAVTIDSSVPDVAVIVPDMAYKPQDTGSASDTYVQDIGSVGIYELYVTVPSGWFYMGSPTTELCRNANETLHKVTLTRSFEVKATEVTQGQFTKLMGYNPSYFGPSGAGGVCGDSCPVESLTWYQAAAYCNQLSVASQLATCYSCTGTGQKTSCTIQPAYDGQAIYTCPGYRLPTEAEWEYVYRATTTTAFYNGPVNSTSCVGYDSKADTIAWYDHNGGAKTHPGGQKLPNAWGVYDLAGNVWEYTNDLWTDDLGSSAVIDPCGPTSTGGNDKIVARGGSYNWSLPSMRAAMRASNPKQSKLAWLGFRCVRSK